MIKKIGSYIFLGIGIGAIVSTACLWILGNSRDTLTETTVWLAVSAAYGALSIIMDIEKLPYAVRIFIHGGLCAGLTLATAWGLGYAESLPALLKQVMPTFLIVYAGIWLVFYWSWKLSAKKLNDKLKER